MIDINVQNRKHEALQWAIYHVYEHIKQLDYT